MFRGALVSYWKVAAVVSNEDGGLSTVRQSPRDCRPRLVGLCEFGYLWILQSSYWDGLHELSVPRVQTVEMHRKIDPLD